METQCDPSGDTRALELAKQDLKAFELLVREKEKEIELLRSCSCAICKDTGRLSDSLAWDEGQPDSECPYCPEKVEGYLRTIRRMRSALISLESAGTPRNGNNTCPICHTYVTVWTKTAHSPNCAIGFAREVGINDNYCGEVSK